VQCAEITARIDVAISRIGRKFKKLPVKFAVLAKLFRKLAG
jgi:hypothetical protein